MPGRALPPGRAGAEALHLLLLVGTGAKLWLSSAGSDAERLLDGFFDTHPNWAKKMEEEAYKAIAQEIGLARRRFSSTTGNVDEAGRRRLRRLRHGADRARRGDSGKHPAAADLVRHPAVSRRAGELNLGALHRGSPQQRRPR